MVFARLGKYLCSGGRQLCAGGVEKLLSGKWDHDDRKLGYALVALALWQVKVSSEET